MKLLQLGSDVAVNADGDLFYKTTTGEWGRAGVDGKPVKIDEDALTLRDLSKADLEALEPTE